MPPLLLLDASFYQGIIAHLSSEHIFSFERVPLGPLAGEELSERLAPLLEQREPVEGLALGVGPGSYTGMRVAAALLLPLALALGLPLITFPSLRGIAPPGERGVADAKRGRLYLLEGEETRAIPISDLPLDRPLYAPTPLKKSYPLLESYPILESPFRLENLLPLLEKKWREGSFEDPLTLRLRYEGAPYLSL